MVPPALREELRQGLFANTERYGAVMRFSTNPGWPNAGCVSCLLVPSY
jgi:hypothetical protein